MKIWNLIWSYAVLGFTAYLLIYYGLGVLGFFMLPLFLGYIVLRNPSQAPEWVFPMLISVGYAFVLGYVVLVVFALKHVLKDHEARRNRRNGHVPRVEKVMRDESNEGNIKP